MLQTKSRVLFIFLTLLLLLLFLLSSILFDSKLPIIDQTINLRDNNQYLYLLNYTMFNSFILSNTYQSPLNCVNTLN